MVPHISLLQVGVEHDDPAGEERERQLGAGGLDLGHGHRSGRQSGSMGIMHQTRGLFSANIWGQSSIGIESYLVIYRQMATTHLSKLTLCYDA